MNGRLVASRPCPISTSCGSDERTRLPKLTNTTVRSLLDSSQLTHRTALAFSAVAANGTVGARKRGPMVHTFLLMAAS
ncbi:hypothetical protein Zm00014a_031325 [Zea mays]|uniref:Uncharacterized protein n=1 Tax=Zea mays TaxID=4577 RepID=A0A3L6EV49_MAIZE|nr:hypothetical protein Zm00014a_031325 [Zea mays]